MTISASGTYIVDDSITDGQILVNIADTTANADSVDITLQDVTMTSSTGAPCIYAQSADKVKLTLTGTNTLTDTATATNSNISGVIAAECDLTITKNSTGTLDITSSMNRGIFCKDDLKLSGSTINIVTDVDDTSDTDAIRANNTLKIDGATVTIDSSADVLKSNKEDIAITSGTVSIKAGNDAIQAVAAITISGGDVVASGDRGLTVESGGALTIKGGNILATATDNTVDTTTVYLSSSTQTVAQLSYAAEWKKGNAVTLIQNGSTVYEMTPIKKFDYVLISGDFSSSATYQLYTGGTQMTHDGSTTGEFIVNGSPAAFTGVTELTGCGTITDDTDTVAVSLVYASNSVTAYNTSGSVVSSPSNVTIDGTSATVTLPSKISVSGSCSNSRLAVDVDKTTYSDGQVILTLEGLELSNSTMAPIYVEAIGDEVQISVKNGTTNTISDGTTHTDTYTDNDGNTETVNAAIFSRDNLKIKGKDTLNVNGNTEDGIVCKNDLKLWNGTITVNAVDDGIRGNDSVRISNPNDMVTNGSDGDFSTLNVTVNTNNYNNSSTGGDGIKANSTDDGSGYVVINSGTVNINSYADGIQAEQDFTMNDGTLNITTFETSTYTDSGSMSSGSTGSFNPGGMGDTEDSGNTNKVDNSCKDIKSVGLYDETGTTWQSGGNLTINGGTITIDSSDDSLHCGDDMTLVGGVFTLASADDGMYSDHSLTIDTANAGTYDDISIYISACYEGVEGMTINQNSGTVCVISSDDGYNAAGGVDSSGSSSTSPGDNFIQGGKSISTGDMYLNGGLVVVNSTSGDHDGFDSNGGLTITGGYYCANDQDPIDSEQTNTNTGGNIITMSADNTNLTTRYSFCNSNGNVIVSFVSASGSTVLATSNCTAYSGGTVSSGTELLTQSPYQLYAGGTLSNGTMLSSSSSGGSTTPGGGNMGGGF